MFVLAVAFVFGITGANAVLAAGPASINLGTAGNFSILSKSGISTTGSTLVVGDIGVSPAEATYITGFGLSLNAGSAYSTSSLVVGKVYAPSYANPTPVNLTTAVSNMETAYTDGAGRTNPTATELGAGNIGGLTLAPGLYKWSTGVTIPSDVTLSGSANDVWIFQIAQNLNVSSAVKINLAGGALSNNIFWVVAGQTTIGTTAVFNGNILDQTAIVLNTDAKLNGRALAQTAVTLDANYVNIPSAFNEEGSASVTSTVAQSPTPVTLYVAPGVTETTMSTGCSGGNQYNTSTGAICVNNTEYANPLSVQHRVYNFGTVNLKHGSKGEAAKELQRFLNARFALGLVIDGNLGIKTITALKAWQRNHDLTPDGIAGYNTKLKMIEEAKIR